MDRPYWDVSSGSDEEGELGPMGQVAAGAAGGKKGGKQKQGQGSRGGGAHEGGSHSGAESDSGASESDSEGQGPAGARHSRVVELTAAERWEGMGVGWSFAHSMPTCCTGPLWARACQASRCDVHGIWPPLRCWVLVVMHQCHTSVLPTLVSIWAPSHVTSVQACAGGNTAAGGAHRLQAPLPPLGHTRRSEAPRV